ncbi:MAG: glycine cleavage system protein H [Fuerstiella sp.]|nr:glycine cleavage system protein H [Fuerstiella sp.]
MADQLHFMMGKFRADIPCDRDYSPRHLWLKSLDDQILRVGLTAYSVRLLQDVYFLEWSIDPGTYVVDRQEIGEIESSKAVSSLFTPCAGLLIDFNETLLNDPSAINTDNYGNGWLFDMKTEDRLLTPEEYIELLADGWEKTQRTIKGQLH